MAAIAAVLGHSSNGYAGEGNKNVAVNVTIYFVTLGQESKALALAGKEGMDDKGIIRMNDRQVKEFASQIQKNRVNFMMMPRLATRSGQLAEVDVTECYKYVKAAHVENDNGQPAVKTETGFIPLGVRFEAVPTVSADGKTIDIYLKGFLANLTGPVPVIPATALVEVNGKMVQMFIQLPNVNKFEFEKSLSVADGETALFPIRKNTTGNNDRQAPLTTFLSKIPLVDQLLRHCAASTDDGKMEYLLVTGNVVNR